MRDLGVDQGAAQVSLIGDWTVTEGSDARRLSLLRRLTTPLGALWYDRSFGNAAYSRLSQPVTNTWLQLVSDECRQAAEREAGVRVTDARVETRDRVVQVKLTVTWDDQRADSVVVTL